MKRREFIKRAAPATVLPFMLNGFRLKAYAGSRYLNTLFNAGAQTDRVLVLIQMIGGNDGLNTVIPLDQYANYYNARTNIAIPEANVLALTSETGLHPEMGMLRTLYGEGKVRLVQSVGYPTPDYSHFRSTDIWLTGSDYDEYLNTGWLGRYLDYEFPNYPDDYPNAAMPDPLAIQIGSSLSTGLEGPLANMGMSFSNPASFYNIINPSGNGGGSSRAQTELEYIRSVGRQLDKFAAPVKTAAGRATNKSALYPAAKQNALADQLKIVATLIAGGLKTKVYIVNITGFDTHSNQISGGNGTPVPHGTLLNQLSVAVAAFQDDLKLLGIEDRVVGMTFSEFGRRIKSNGSGGTDHGAAAPMFVFGSSVIPGVLGTNPTIPSSVTAEDNVPMLYDFRSVYSSILQDWFCASQDEIRSVLFRDFEILPIIKPTPSSVRDERSTGGRLTLLSIAPNPFRERAEIRFATAGGHVRGSVFDGNGREIATLVDRTLEGGEHSITFDGADLPSGNYYCRLQNGPDHAVYPMTLTR